MKEKKKILIGTTGGIAVYKICGLARLFVKEGFSVKVMMSEKAAEFVSPSVFQAIVHFPVYVSGLPCRDENGLDHLNLAHWPDIVVLAPATANTIGKIANGIADNLLTTVVLALAETIPLVVAPSMNVNMWRNVFVRENIKRLKKRKNCYIVGPAKGPLAEGKKGRGRMVEPEEIYKTTKRILKS